MDSLISAAAQALAAGDPLGALKRVALRNDAPALALRGIAMAQLGDLVRAKDPAAKGGARLRRARSRGPRAVHRCGGRDCARLARLQALSGKALDAARAHARAARRPRQRRACAASRGSAAAADRPSRRGRSASSRKFDAAPLPPALRAAHELVVAGIAMRRVQIKASARGACRGRACRASGGHSGARCGGRKRRRLSSTRRPRA